MSNAPVQINSRYPATEFTEFTCENVEHAEEEKEKEFLTAYKNQSERGKIYYNSIRILTLD